MEDLTVFSVFEITRHIRQVLESSIEPLYVSGEISGFVHHGSGHMYFNLKDENATLRCTYFKNANYRLDFKPAEGMQVICYGRITLFEKGGTYNLNVQSMSQAGLGIMQQKIELLKRKLNAEGLFAPAHKKPIPRYPKRIGIVTSPSGAALQDIQNIIVRRYSVELLVYPALVQGNEAAAQIIAGVKYFNDSKAVDLIIVTRGGGSPEDLFCFNDEALVRAVFASQLPVISAVGHEIDFTLIDFVADLRAPTPSAAAELAVPDKKDLLEYLASLSRRLALLQAKKTAELRTGLSDIQFRLSRYHPERLWQSYQQRFDMANIALLNSVKQMDTKRMLFKVVAQQSISRIQNRLEIYINKASHNCESINQQMQNNLSSKLQAFTMQLQRHSEVLAQLSPRRIQSKGWIMAHRDGKLVGSVKQIHPQDIIKLSFIDGSANSEIISTEEAN